MIQCSGGSRISLRWGANPKGGVANLLFKQIPPQNCMKLKKIGPMGVRPLRPLRFKTEIDKQLLS